MEINKHEDLGVVDIWLTHKDQANPAAQAKAQELSRRYKAENMTVAVFYSGQLNLEEETAALLRYNRQRFAERAVQQRKAQKQRECR